MASHTHTNDRVTPAGDIEGRFRREVRDALDMDIFTRDFQIIEEIKRLKAVEKYHQATASHQIGPVPTTVAMNGDA